MSSDTPSSRNPQDDSSNSSHRRRSGRHRSSGRSGRGSSSNAASGPLQSFVPGALEFLCRAVCILLIILTPWFLGSVQWTYQQMICWGAAGLVCCLALLAIAKVIFQQTAPRVPWTSWVFLALAAWAWLQSQQVFSVLDDSGWTPQSVVMQRWALGVTESPKAKIGRAHV